MKKVNVHKDNLLEELQTNRENHREIYEEALEGYKDKVRAELENYLQRVENGDVLSIRVNLPRPEDHTDDYDRAIKMVQMSVDDELELTENEFAQYVMDDWGWKQSFTASTAMYTSS